MNLAFMGSPAFAVPALQALAAAGHHIAAVYCQPPRPAHRGQALTKCAVHLAAEALGLPVRTPTRLKADPQAQARFAALDLDVAIVAAYGLILPPDMLSAPRRGCLNIHASLLPRWRGAAPIHAAILANDAQTGITIMQMDAGLDTGPMLLSSAINIPPRATTPELHDALATLGATLMLRALAENPTPTPQPETGATYAAKLTREDGRLHFATRPATQLDCQIRALTPWPGTFAQFGPEPLKILQAEPVAAAGPPGTILSPDFTVACASGALRLLRVQKPGRPPTPGPDFLRGVPNWPSIPLT